MLDGHWGLAMDLFKFVLVPSGQVQVLYPVFQLQMDPEAKKKRRRRRGFAKINTTHSLKGKGINHCKTDGSQVKDSDKCV